jgi:purine-nucleoside phosphorylase
MNLEQAIEYRDNYEKKVIEAANFVKKRIGELKPSFGIVLGSGLGNLADFIEHKIEIPYSKIPNFPKTTVEGHEGKLIIGEIENIPIIALKGRKHYYEVADEPFNTGILQVVFPVHVLASLGVSNYFVTNAAGALNQKYKIGDIMAIKSHINLIPNPLLGRHHNFNRVNNGKRVSRFEPMDEAYDSLLRGMLVSAAKKQVHEGNYLALTGPTYETEAESIAFRKMGADTVGMSSVPEVIVAKNRGMKVVGFSCITNVIDENGKNATSHDEVKSILENSEIKKRLTNTLKNFFRIYEEKQ